MANTTIFNEKQLVTYESARAVALRINSEANPIGGGVAPESASPDLSGIYTDLWLNPGEFPEPGYIDDVTGVQYYPLRLRFQNGASGFNVGLIIQEAKGHTPPCEKGQPPPPLNWKYALDHLRSEVDAWAKQQ